MLRVWIHATPDTDVDAETASLRRVAETDGLEPGLIDGMAAEADRVVRDFVNRGRELKALGTRLTAERVVRGEGYEVRVTFNTRPRPDLLRRILAVFRT
jgi:hypothetical protein